MGRADDLPEEVVDHVYNLASVHIDKDDIVIIPNPAIGTVNRGQAVRPGIVDPVTLSEEQVVEEEPDPQPAVTVAIERRIVAPEAEEIAIRRAVIAPAEPAIVAPSAPVPSPEIAPTVTISASVGEPVVAPAAVVPVEPAIVAKTPVVTASCPYAIAKTVAADRTVLEAVVATFCADAIAESVTADGAVLEAIVASFCADAIAKPVTADSAVLETVVASFCTHAIAETVAADRPIFPPVITSVRPAIVVVVEPPAIAPEGFALGHALIDAPVDSVDPNIAAPVDTFGPDIPAPFDPVGLAVSPAFDPGCGSIAALPGKLEGGARRPALYPLRTSLAATVDLLRALRAKRAFAPVCARGVPVGAAFAAIGAAIAPVGLNFCG